MKRRYDTQKKEKRNYQIFFKTLFNNCEHTRVEPPKCAVDLTIIFFFKKAKSNKSKYHIIKPDADNLEKFLLDAGNGYLWHDDCQIVNVNKKKCFGEVEKTEVIVKYLL
jgi:Holliday junction resolvase RusA-like endonuclease